MRGVRGIRALRVLVFLGLVVLAWRSAKVLRSASLASGETDLEQGRGLLPSNAAYVQGLARWALVQGEGERAAALAEESIRLFPYRGSAWLDLAEARLKLGDREGTREAVRKAAMLGPSKGKWRWRGALLLLQAGLTDDAVAELASVVRVDRSRRYDAYDVAWKVFDQPQAVLERVVPAGTQARLDYVFYLMGKHRVEPAIEVWETAEQAATEEQRYAYIDFLLSHKAVEQAWRAWLRVFPGARLGSIHNPSFRDDITGHGFGWRLGRVEGALARVARMPGWERPSLEVRFSGGNPHFNHSQQIVAVTGRTNYKLVASVRWQEVTSASSPHLYVRGFAGCGHLNVESKGLSGSGETRIEIEFETPPDCRAIVVGLERLATRKLDHDITGVLWMKRVELRASRASATSARLTGHGRRDRGVS